MIVSQRPPVHLTYCLNIHPGESWEENFAAIRTRATAVRDRVAPDGPFGLGLRLSAQAAGELNHPDRLDELKGFLNNHGLYVFTVNGFPYGTFHEKAVKADVYRPDWRTTERRDYTVALADILAALLPEDVPGSISTVPGSYREWLRSDADIEQIAHRLAEVATHLARLRNRAGRDICLALEPEPDCLFETGEEAAAFCTATLRRVGREFLKLNFGMEEEAADALLARHVGVCLDAAHEAVAFRDPADSMRALTAAGVKLAKLQLSAALACDGSAAADRLQPFCDRTYLHQVKTRNGGDGKVNSHPDLPAALAEKRRPTDEWRVHFHVPLHWSGEGPIRSTRDQLLGDVAALLRSGACPHLEIETYTFDVLPESMRALPVDESIAREYRWVLHELLGAG
jgi:sugar phosphate isomerase/epimerase